jgi:hypothetical protein
LKRYEKGPQNPKTPKPQNPERKYSKKRYENMSLHKRYKTKYATKLYRIFVTY